MKCARRACESEDANFYNHSTRQRYCAECARRINLENAVDAQKLYGHQLCTPVVRLADWSDMPGPRYRRLGDHSAEEFRDEVLAPVLKENDLPVMVDLDGCIGIPASFSEEVFGGLVRSGFNGEDILRRLTIVCRDEPDRAVDANDYILEETYRDA